MDNREFEELGDKIQDIIEKAVNSQDYKKLNQNISQTVKINGSDSSVNHWLKSRNSDMITVRTPSSSSQPEPISTPLVPAKTTISAMPAASMKMPSIRPADRTATSSLHKQ